MCCVRLVSLGSVVRLDVHSRYSERLKRFDCGSLFFFSFFSHFNMAEEEPTTTEEVAEEVEQVTPFLATEGNDKANLVLSLASAILFDGSAEFTVRVPTSPRPPIATALMMIPYTCVSDLRSTYMGLLKDNFFIFTSEEQTCTIALHAHSTAPTGFALVRRWPAPYLMCFGVLLSCCAG